MATTYAMFEDREKNSIKSQIKKLDGLSDKVKTLMNDIVDTHNVSCGQDLVHALTKSEQFPEKVKDLNQQETSELDTHLLALLVDQHYKTQKMVDRLNSKLEAKLEAMDQATAKLNLQAEMSPLKVPPLPPAGQVGGGGGYLPQFSFNPFGSPSEGDNKDREIAIDVKIPKVSWELDKDGEGKRDNHHPRSDFIPPAAPSARGFWSNPFAPVSKPKIEVGDGTTVNRDLDVKLSAPSLHLPHGVMVNTEGGSGDASMDLDTPPTPLLDWILGMNTNSIKGKSPPKVPMLIVNVTTTSVTPIPNGIDHCYTVTAVNTTPDEIKQLIDEAIVSGAFTKTLREAGFPSASSTIPCTMTDVTPEENPLKRTVVDITHAINGLSISDTNTPAFKSAIGGTVPRLAAATLNLQSPGEDTLPKGLDYQYPPPPIVILDFSLKSLNHLATPEGKKCMATYSIMALNTTPQELQEVVENAVKCGSFTRALRKAGFPHARCVDPLIVRDTTPTVNPLKKTVLEMEQAIFDVTAEECNRPAFKLALGEAVVCAPSSSLNAPNLDELPEVQVPIFDLDVLLPKWSLSYPSLVFPTMDSSAGENPPHPHLSTASPPIQVVSMRIKKVTPFPTPLGEDDGVMMVYDVTAIHCKSAAELNAMVDHAIRSGAMTKAIQHAGLTNAMASKPAIPRDITPTPTPSSSSEPATETKTETKAGGGAESLSTPSSSSSTVIVEYTQIIDRFSVADSESPAFKSAFGGQWPRLAALHAGTVAPGAPSDTSVAPPVIISVVVKSAKLRGATAQEGVEILYAVTAIHTTKEALQMVLNKAVASGYFTQALRQSGYPHAEAKQALECVDVTPTPNPKALTIVEVSQVVDGISVEEANSPAFRALFNDAIATSTMVSPTAPDVYQIDPSSMHMPAFSFRSFVDPLFRPFRTTNDPHHPSLSSDHPSDDHGQGHGPGTERGVGVEVSNPTLPPHKRLAIIKVTTFSVGPLPFGNGIIHGFLVTAENAQPNQLKDIINGAIKAGYFTQSFQNAGFPRAAATDPLDIADDMTSVYHPKENPLSRTVLYCQHRIDNMDGEETKTPAFKSAFGSVISRASDPFSAAKMKDSKSIVITDVVMDTCVPSGAHNCEASYTVTALHTTPEELKSVLDTAARQGLFTQALKDAGFSSAIASEAVDVHITPAPTTITGDDKPLVATVKQRVQGVLPVEGNTPSFGTALTNAVALSPTITPDPPKEMKLPQPQHGPTLAQQLAALFGAKPSSDPANKDQDKNNNKNKDTDKDVQPDNSNNNNENSNNENGKDGKDEKNKPPHPPGPDIAQQLAALNRAIGNSVPTLPHISVPFVDDPLYQLDPPTRKPSNSKASSDRVMSDNINKATDAIKEGVFGKPKDLPKGKGSMGVEILPRAKKEIPGLIEENDGPGDDDKMLEGEEEREHDHAVTGHLFYDMYKAIYLS